MFFEEREINEITTCFYCMKKYTDPRILRCGNSLCFDCIQFLVNKEANGLMCPICEEFHVIPKHGFTKNLSLTKLVLKKSENIYRGTIAENFKEQLKELKHKINDLNSHIINPIGKLKEYCGDLKNEIQLESEIKIEKIKTFNIELIKKIENYEQTCIDKLKFDDEFKSNFESITSDLNNFYKKWTDYLNKATIDDIELKKVSTEANKLLEKVDRESLDFRNKLFNGKIMKFDKNPKEIDSSIVGIIKNIDIKWNILNKINDIRFLNLKSKINQSDKLKVKLCECGDFWITSIDSSRSSLNMVKLDNFGNILNRAIIPTIKSRCTYMSINDFKLAALNTDFFIFISYNNSLDDYSDTELQEVFNTPKGNFYLKKYDQYLKFKHEVRCSNISLMTTYDNKIYALAKQSKHSTLFVYDTNLIQLEKFDNNLVDMPYYFSNTISQIGINEKIFILLDDFRIKLMDKKNGMITKSFYFNSNNFILFNDENLMKFDSESKVLVSYDLDGIVSEYKLDNITTTFQLVDCCNQHLVFLDSAQLCLTFN